MPLLGFGTASPSQMTANSHKRKRKLIEPALQFKILGVFIALASCSLLLQMMLLNIDLQNIAQNMKGGEALQAEIPGIMQRMLLFSAGMCLPATIAVGIVLTHRIAGPIYRFKQHLNSVAAGEVVGKCRIRKRDEMQGLCDSLNRALSAAFASQPPVEGEPEGEGQVDSHEAGDSDLAQAA